MVRYVSYRKQALLGGDYLDVRTITGVNFGVLCGLSLPFDQHGTNLAREAVNIFFTVIIPTFICSAFTLLRPFSCDYNNDDYSVKPLFHSQLPLCHSI